MIRPQKKKPAILETRRPVVYVIGGPNGAGKTTFAREFLLSASVAEFLNADLLASGLSPLYPASMAVRSARLLLDRWRELVSLRKDFAFESTLSGLTYAKRMREWKVAGYRIEIVFLRLASVRLALRRIADRVRQGGHTVPAADVRRRFHRGWKNFETAYRALADAWAVYDNSAEEFRLVEEGP